MRSLARFALPVAVLLAACGGGGGGDIAPPPAAATINVAAAWRDYVTGSHSWVMAGKDIAGHTVQLSVDLRPGASANFPLTNATGLTIDQTLRLTVDGNTVLSTEGTLFFTAASLLGVASKDGACAGVRTAMTALPGASAVGAAGTMFVLDGYAGCAVTGQRLGTSTFSWSVQQDQGLIMFCITSRNQGADGADLGGEVDCIEANADGMLGAKAKFTITRADGNSVSGKNY